MPSFYHMLNPNERDRLDSVAFEVRCSIFRTENVTQVTLQEKHVYLVVYVWLQLKVAFAASCRRPNGASQDSSLYNYISDRVSYCGK